MHVLWGRGRRRSRGLVGAIVYLIFLVTVPFEHDDFPSHLKNPTHCTACMSSALGSAPKMPVTVGAWSLSDAGRAAIFSTIPDSVLLLVRSTGRSPPANA